MTVVFSAVSPLHLILMTVDSAVTLEFTEQDRREYHESVKVYRFGGVGCVGLWGAMDGNRVGEFLREQNISSQSHSVVDLANLVNEYLKQEYRPHERGVGEVGYHVAGYDRNGRPRLYHVFYGFDRPRDPRQEEPHYRCYTHADPPDKHHFLYNGRNDLADMLIRKLLHEIEQGGDARYDVRMSVGLARFADFVVRFSAEMTPEVGPPFLTHIISPRNQIVVFADHTFCPIPLDTIKEGFLRLGYEECLNPGP